MSTLRGRTRSLNVDNQVRTLPAPVTPKNKCANRGRPLITCSFYSIVQPPTPTAMLPSASGSSLWSDLPRRLATVCLGAPLVVAVLSHRTTCRLFFLAVHMLCCLEWIRLVPADGNTSGVERTKTSGAERTNTSVVPESLPLPFRLFPFASLLTIHASPRHLALALSLSAAAIHLSPYATNIISADISHTAAAARQHGLHGLLYLSLSFHCLLRISSASFAHLVWFLFVVWNGDTGALLAGRLGRMMCRSDLVAAICPQAWIDFVGRISPSKSMTGLVGGVLGAAATAVYWPNVMLWVQSTCLRLGLGIGRGYPAVFGWLDDLAWAILPLNDGDVYFDLDQIDAKTDGAGGAGILDFNGLPLPSILAPLLPTDALSSPTFRRALVGVVLGGMAILGDLIESSVKRASHQKDSGKLLPGHGGILDRFDSTLLSAVVYYHWCLAGTQ